MKKEGIIIIVGIIILVLLYYYLSKKTTTTTAKTGLIAQAQTTLDKIKSTAGVTSKDITNIVESVTGLIGAVSKNDNSATSVTTTDSPTVSTGGLDGSDIIDYSTIA